MLRKAGLLLVLAIFAPSVYADVAFLKLSELDELLKANNGSVPGYFDTVAEGTVKKTYNVIIMDKIDMEGTTVIMFKTMHYIAAGMSGSPVYYVGPDGRKKLVGALAYFFNQFPAREKWGGISPIEKMKEESDRFEKAFHDFMSGKSGANKLPDNFTYKGMNFEPIPLGTRLLTGKSAEAAAQIGLDAKARFTVGTQPSGIKNKPRYHPAKLEAGMPIVADLFEMTDDEGNTSSVGAMGTITYVGPQGQIYAFGHPFLGAGYVMYQFKTCKVISTLLSEQFSFKLQGESSDVYGFIGMDGRYGIYGLSTDGNSLSPAKFYLSLQAGDNKPSRYTVSLARTPIMPTLLSFALNYAGELFGAPPGEMPSMAEMKATVNVAGYPPLKFDDIFASTSMQFGAKTIYKSSYLNAQEAFMADVFERLNNAPFDVGLDDFDVNIRFTQGTKKVLYVASVKFPDKVVYGTTPELDVLLVSEDNSVAFSRKIPVAIDWSKVESPSYTLSAKDTAKSSEKIIRGNVKLYTKQFLLMHMSDTDKEREKPSYFLNVAEYMHSVFANLRLTNKKLFVKTTVTRKSGDVPVSTEAPLPTGVFDGTWTIYPEGLNHRVYSMKSEPSVSFSNVPEAVPGAYMLAPVNKVISYEVVLAEPVN